jgi:hypothetical protein
MTRWVRARLTLEVSGPGPVLRPVVAVTVPCGEGKGKGMAPLLVPLAAWPWVRAALRALGYRVHEPPVLRRDYDPVGDMAGDLAAAGRQGQARGW